MSKWILLIFPLSMLMGWVEAATDEGQARPEAGLAQPLVLESSHLADTLIGLALVLGLMLALAWLVKRFVSLPGMGKGQVQVLGGVSLGPRERAVLVSVEGQRLLLGVAPGRVQTLHVLDNVTGEQPQAEDFAAQLQQVRPEKDA